MRKLGQELAAMEKNKGAAEKGWQQRPSGSEGRSAPKLEDIGISYNSSSRAQAIARMPEERQ